MSMTTDPISKRINTRVGCGNSQLLICLVILIVQVCDGQEMLVMSIVNLRLKKIWNLTPSAEGTLGSCVFAGVMVGSLISGAMNDTIGRRYTLIIFLSVLALSGLGSALAPSLVWLVAIRTVAGIGLGGVIPSVTTIISEVIPDLYRAKTMLCISLGFVLGEALTSLQSIFLDTTTGENWRWLLAVSALPAFVALLAVVLFVDESPRYLYVTNRKEEALEILNQMEDRNTYKLCCCCCGIKKEKKMLCDNNKTMKDSDNEKEDTAIYDCEDEDEDGNDREDNENENETEKNAFLRKRRNNDKQLRKEDDEDILRDVDGAAGASDIPTFRSLFNELFKVARPIDSVMVWFIFIVSSVTFYGLVWVFPLTLKEGGAKEESTSIGKFHNF